MEPSRYAEEHFDDFLEDLKNLVRIPSVSASGFPPEQMQKSAEAVTALLKSDGLENVEILHVEGAPPYVYADWLHAPGKPTVLLYAHHDVQPVGREHLWTEPPFEPMVKNGRLTGRGSSDDKAGIMVHVGAVRAFMKTAGKLPINVRFIIDGEEETGSTHLNLFLEKYRNKMLADLIVLTDTGNFDVGIPTVTTSLRGLVGFDLEVSGMKGPLHSGSFGGPAPDPTMALSKLLATLIDDEGKISVAGIYDDVLPLSQIEESSLSSLDYKDEKFAHEAKLLPGVKVIGGKYPALKKISRLPSLTVNAFEASSKKNVSTRINESAWARVTVRIVPNMDGKKILELVKNHLKARNPWGMQLKFSNEAIGNWWLTNPEGKYFEKVQRTFTRAFGRKCVFIGQGGSIPFVKPFSEALGGVPAILIGVEDPYCNAHAENESLEIADFKHSIVGAVYFYQALAEN